MKYFKITFINKTDLCFMCLLTEDNLDEKQSIVRFKRKKKAETPDGTGTGT
jgi:hypothetical protein